MSSASPLATLLDREGERRLVGVHVSAGCGRVALNAKHGSIDQCDVISAELFATVAAQFGGTDARQAKISVNAATVPVACVAAVDQHDAVAIARTPDGGAQSGQAATDDADVEDLVE